MGFDTLLAKSMQEEMRGISAAGDNPYTAGPNTWLRRWGGEGEKLKKMKKMKSEPGCITVWRSKQRGEIQLGKRGHQQKDSAVALSC